MTRKIFYREEMFRISNRQIKLHVKCLSIFALLIFSLIFSSSKLIAAEQYIPLGDGEEFITYNGIPFDLDGEGLHVIKTSSEFIPIDTLDLSGYSANKIHFLVAAAFATNVPNGVTVGKIRVYYEDGSFDAIDLIMGLNIAEWAYDRPENQCCLAHDKVAPAQSELTNSGSEYFYLRHRFYVYIETQNKPLDYLELTLDEASYTGQPDCPETCTYYHGLEPWFANHIDAVTIESSVLAVTVYDTMQYGDTTSNSVAVFYGEDQYGLFNQPAYKFTAAYTVSLDSILIRAKSYNYLTGTETVIRIFADAAGLPGILLEEWTTLIEFSGLDFMNITVLSLLNPILQENDDYWVSVCSTGGYNNGGGWRFAEVAPSTDFQRATALDGSAEPSNWFLSSGPIQTAMFKVDGTLEEENSPPVAQAGPDQNVVAGDAIQLLGSATDPDGDPIVSWFWSIQSAPVGSSGYFDDPSSQTPVFTTDLPGEYVLSLVVNDGVVDSAPATTTITAVTIQDAAVDELIASVDTINGLAPDVLKNENMSNALTNKINAAIELIDQGLYEDALNKLENDILGKTNGCAETGFPDRNDWITNCDDQGEVYQFVLEAIELVCQLL